MATPEQIEVMARHYLIAAIWADSPDGTNPRATAAALQHARQVCTRFVECIGPSLFDAAMSAPGYGAHPDCGQIHPECAAMGHDLYLTSAGHGVGFWDRDALAIPADESKPDGQTLGDALSGFCGHGCAIPEPQTYFYRGWIYFQ